MQKELRVEKWGGRKKSAHARAGKERKKVDHDKRRGGCDSIFPKREGGGERRNGTENSEVFFSHSGDDFLYFFVA